MASAVPKPSAPIDPGLKAVVLAAIRKGEENVKVGGGPFGAAVVKNDGSFEVVSCEVRLLLLNSRSHMWERHC
jgi:hypothetical protein